MVEWMKEYWGDNLKKPQPRQTVTETDLEEIIELWNGKNCPVDGSKVPWNVWRKEYAKTILKMLREKGVV